MSYLSMKTLVPTCLSASPAPLTVGKETYQVSYRTELFHLYGTFLVCEIHEISDETTYYKIYVKGPTHRLLHQIDVQLKEIPSYYPILHTDTQGTFFTVGKNAVVTNLLKFPRSLYLNIKEIRRHIKGLTPLLYLVHGEHRSFTDDRQPVPTCPPASTGEFRTGSRLPRRRPLTSSSREISRNLSESLVLEDDSTND
jgi:hypothetical protein